MTKYADKSTPTLRCAIYTRKSTDENLGLDFNSLDAQREAGEAYIRSQQHEGWVCLEERYDDAGYLTSGTLRLAVLTGESTASGSEGPLGDFSITNFSRSEPLEEGVTVSVTAKLAVFEEWVEVA